MKNKVVNCPHCGERIRITAIPTANTAGNDQIVVQKA